jgi:hypothetical protein
MNTADRQIADILAKYGEPFAGNVWRVQGTAVIYHKALERIAAQAQIHFDAPMFLRTERDEAVILVTGRMGERVEWSIGEALVNVNYRVSGKQAAYVYAMAEKRAKDRVILKLIELHGLVYSEEEADEFRRGAPADPSAGDPTNARPSEGQGEQQAAPAADALPAPSPVPIRAGRKGAQSAAKGAKHADAQAGTGSAPHEDIEAQLKRNIDKAKSIDAVTDVMLHPDTQKSLGDLPQGVRDEIRDYAKARLVALGWPSKKAA